VQGTAAVGIRTSCLVPFPFVYVVGYVGFVALAWSYVSSRWFRLVL